MNKIFPLAEIVKPEKEGKTMTFIYEPAERTLVKAPVKASNIDKARKQEIKDMFKELIELYGYAIPRKMLHDIDKKVINYIEDAGPIPIRIQLDPDYSMIIDSEIESFRGIFRYVLYDSRGTVVGNDSGSFEFLSLKLQNAITDKINM